MNVIEQPVLKIVPWLGNAPLENLKLDFRSAQHWVMYPPWKKEKLDFGFKVRATLGDVPPPTKLKVGLKRHLAM